LEVKPEDFIEKEDFEVQIPFFNYINPDSKADLLYVHPSPPK